MKFFLSFTPHIAYECLEMFYQCYSSNTWPVIDKKNILNETKLAVQINGKTRDVLTVKKTY